MKICVLTLGCKVNECESRSLITTLREKGHDVTEELVSADCYVINTCSVTGEADRKSRQTVGKAIKANPEAKIYVCGCSSQRDSSAYEKHENVVFITGNGTKSDIIQYVMSDIVPKKKDFTRDIPKHFEYLAVPAHEKTRDYIKVQDGCNNFCSYCIIPYVRGRSRSRDIDDVIREATISANRTKEIVLTGIDVSSYGKDVGSSLKELAERMATIPVIKRISSFECTVIDDELLSTLKSAGFCDHFHLSLQSGSDKILKKMNRHYTTEEYMDKVKLIRKHFPNAGITTDVITGFPTETEEDFSDTYEFIKNVGFSDMHVFPYSERKGTKATNFPQLRMDERRRRARVLGVLKEESKSNFLKKQIGQTLSVYYEEDMAGLSVGYAENYVRVYGNGKPGEIEKKTISEIYKEGVK
ncbi:MAG: tRNA (N(6)-L-threonylcarbamoyladenosine(37)-C(2))-methylthiotransferase MtaB [Clostridia bacterium]|nr:tRNA (N(6)-L-threonylcarbamoyladenosine(37)-C(2))-methylthiotransferase MtaB [Clostridia bacterium]